MFDNSFVNALFYSTNDVDIELTGCPKKGSLGQNIRNLVVFNIMYHSFFNDTLF